MGMGTQTGRRVQQQFKLRGVALVKDALQAVLEFMAKQLLSEAEAVDLIMRKMEKQDLKSSIVSKAVVEAVISSLGGDQAEEAKVFQFIDAFEMPKNYYDPIRKRFFRSEKKPSIHGEAASKTALYRERYQLLQQRLLRDRDFLRPALALDGAEARHKELMPLQSLIGSPGPKYVLGAISQLEDGRFFLEDLSSSIPLDLTGAVTLAGLYTENSMVVVEGELLPTGVFKANFLGSPTLEKREESLRFTAGLDFFGGGVPNLNDNQILMTKEKDAIQDSIIFISDLWLDDDKTLDKFNRVLDGYEEMDVVPALFVLIGNFCSKPCGLGFHEFALLRAQFAKLGAMVAAHSRIKAGSQFVFVPGPGDPGPVGALPRPALPKAITGEISRHLPTAVFASNPCRLKWYAQEIVVFREDLLHRMRRACVVPPSEAETAEPFEHLVVTLLQQSHLCPLPLTVRPILWEYDHALRLYPVPHVVVLADRSQQKTFQYEEVTCFNPGSFADDSTFTYYHPADRDVQENLI